jgi:hypothetical protein
MLVAVRRLGLDSPDAVGCDHRSVALPALPVAPSALRLLLGYSCVSLLVEAAYLFLDLEAERLAALTRTAGINRWQS